VPKEQGDALWDRFFAAKKKFFERKDAWRDERRQTLATSLQERIQRNRSFLNKISRDLHREEDLLFDLDDRLANLPATLRSYEKREELNETKQEVSKHIDELKKKVQEVKQKMQADEREMSFIMRPAKKKTDKPNATESASDTNQETVLTELPTASPSNVSENNEATDNHLPEETTQESPL
jgi:chromosome segregation ATPase